MMHVSYVKLFRDEEGTVRDTQEANGEIRNFQHQIELLKQALEREDEHGGRPQRAAGLSQAHCV